LSLSILFNQSVSMLRIYNESMSASLQYFYCANTNANLVEYATNNSVFERIEQYPYVA